MKNEAAIEQNVEIETARAVAMRRGTIAAELALDGKQTLQQRCRGKIRLEGGHRVQKARLIGKSYRGGGVK